MVVLAGRLLLAAVFAVAVGLVASTTAWWAALGALVLLVLSVVVAVSLRRGDAPHCHCFGRLHAARVGRGTLGRNLLLVVVAVVVVGHGRSDVGASATRWLARLGEPGWLALAGALARACVLREVRL
ncbi:MAG: MauE/DoxX family redox-associated membrane protein [Solirubrobacteraceae bacterium]